MNMLGILSFIPTLLGYLGDLPKVIACVEFIFHEITVVEATGQTGEQKLAAVLDSTEAFLATNFPSVAAPFETIAKDVEAVVTMIVDGLNLFAKPAAKV